MPNIIQCIMRVIRPFAVIAIIGIPIEPVQAGLDYPDPAIHTAEGMQIFMPLVLHYSTTSVPGAVTYYISPSGSDQNHGTSEYAPWASFERAWQDLYPGDTLILLDGVYYQSISPHIRSGETGKPITIRAKNDGNAIIDGQNDRIPVEIQRRDFYIIEGIVARNSNYHVFWIKDADHNILRRVSGYNANTDANAHVFTIVGAENNLVEDCIASGSGRKMILIFMANNNTIRRCYTDWRQWDGREWGSCWPWGEGLEIYGGSYNTIENSIAYGNVPRAGISLMAQNPQVASGNNILGSMAILSGMQDINSIMEWADSRPQPSDYTCVQDFENWPSLRAGFRMGDNGEMRDNLFQDIFAWGNAGLGLTYHQAGDILPTSNNRVNRATIITSGLDNKVQFGGINTDAIQSELTDRFDAVENSQIENIFINYNSDGTRNMTSMTGEGARLTHRYIDGTLTTQSLWPWPMEDRIQAELGISVTDMMTNLIFGTNNLAEIYD